MNFSVLTFWIPIYIIFSGLPLFIYILPIHHPNISKISSLPKSWQKSFPDKLCFLNVQLFILFLAVPNFTDQVFCWREHSNILKTYKTIQNATETHESIVTRVFFWNFFYRYTHTSICQPSSTVIIQLSRSFKIPGWLLSLMHFICIWKPVTLGIPLG